MSFYGEQPKLGQLNFKFAAYYPSRKKMTENSATFNTGDYILISYYISPTATTNTAATLAGAPGRFIKDANASLSAMTGTLTYQVTQTTNYTTNLNNDLAEYGNNYHNTVWQCVTSNGTNTFIMIAELNSLAPQLNITYLPSGVVNESLNAPIKDRKVYTIKDNYEQPAGESAIHNLLTFLNKTTSQADPYAILNLNTNNSPKANTFYYNKPEVNLENSSELGYQINMPTVPYVVMNLQENNYQNGQVDNPDNINIAYDSNADAYVINMFLGHMKDYMTKADNGFIIVNGNNGGQFANSSATTKNVGATYYWQNIETIHQGNV